MDILDSSIITGSPGRSRLEPLSVLDILTGHANTAGIYFFQSTLNIDRLKSSLAAALDLYPSFGGSLLEQEGLFYICLDNTGVNFSVVRSHDMRPALHDEDAIISRHKLIDSCALGNDPFGAHTPLNAFKVIIFADGSCALAVSSIHSVGDGAAVGNFMYCWSKHYRNEKLPSTRFKSRDFIKALANGDGHKPSARLAITPRLNFDIGKKIAERKRQCGVIHIDIPANRLRATLLRCRENSALQLTMSDVVHAAAWQAFARSAQFCSLETAKLYTIFDLRRVKGLGIPSDFVGNALLERGAKARFGDLRMLDLPEAALLYRQQVKPLAPLEIGQDIAFLAREYLCGHVDARTGKFCNFVRSSVVDCLDGTGVYVNDMRHLEAARTAFEQPPIWFETIINRGFNTIFVYQNGEDRVSFRYVGISSTLSSFAMHLRKIIFEDSFDVDLAFITTIRAG